LLFFDDFPAAGGMSADVQLAQAQQTIRELCSTRDALAQELELSSSNEATYQILLSDMEVRYAEDLAAALQSNPDDRFHHAGSQIGALCIAHLEEQLHSATEAASVQQEQQTKALSGMFVKLARQRADHERKKQVLQQKLLAMSTELSARKFRDTLLDAQVRLSGVVDHDVVQRLYNPDTVLMIQHVLYIHSCFYMHIGRLVLLIIM